VLLPPVAGRRVRAEPRLSLLGQAPPSITHCRCRVLRFPLSRCLRPTPYQSRARPPLHPSKPSQRQRCSLRSLVLWPTPELRQDEAAPASSFGLHTSCLASRTAAVSRWNTSRHRRPNRCCSTIEGPRSSTAGDEVAIVPKLPIVPTTPDLHPTLECCRPPHRTSEASRSPSVCARVCHRRCNVTQLVAHP
jgi:hypothetical protein